MNPVNVTLLNSMASTDFGRALEMHRQWGLEFLDLKDAIFGKSVMVLTDEEANRATEMIKEQGMTVYCLSTMLFHDDVEIGEVAFRQKHLEPVGRAIAIARILQPKLIRLIAAKSSRRHEIQDSIGYVHTTHPWLFNFYNEAIARITDEGFAATIENEADRCLLSNPAEVLGFFESIGQQESVTFTWDVVNLWQLGTFPSVEVYEALKPLIGYYHLKGGRHDDESQALRWKSSLEDASWPVKDITQRVVVDGVSPVICLNPPHGAPLPNGERIDVEHDLAYIQQLITEEKA